MPTPANEEQRLHGLLTDLKSILVKFKNSTYKKCPLQRGKKCESRSHMKTMPGETFTIQMLHYWAKHHQTFLFEALKRYCGLHPRTARVILNVLLCGHCVNSITPEWSRLIWHCYGTIYHQHNRQLRMIIGTEWFIQEKSSYNNKKKKIKWTIHLWQ